MNTHRNGFIESFAKSTPLLNLIFLNHSGSPVKLLNDITSIDMLADKKAIDDFITFCESHSLVREIRVSRKFRKTEVIIELIDKSELKFHLVRNMIRKALNCLPTEDIRKEAYINEFNMLVASHHHHFEYLMLNCQFAGMPIPDRYKNFFSGFDFTNRTLVFRYIQPRYDFVINNLDELYFPKASILLKIMVGLRKQKENSLLLMLSRTIEFGFFNMFGFITKRVVLHHPTSGTSKEVTGHSRNRTAGQAIL